MIEFAPEAALSIHRHALGSAVGAIIVGIFLTYSLLYQLFIRSDRVMLVATLLQGALLLYLGGYALYASAAEMQALRFWMRVCYTGVALTPLGFHLLIQALLQREAKPRAAVMAGYGLSATLLLWLDRSWLITNRLLQPTALDHPSLVKGPLFPWFVTLTLGLILVTFVDLLRHLRRSPEMRRPLIPFAVTLGVWIANGLYDALIALRVLPGIPHPWVGPVFTVMVIGLFYGQTMANRARSLERRVAELDSLQILGHALGDSFDIDAILTAIYSQVSRLMPAQVFYIALHNAETREVSFPLVVENQQRVTWSPRRWRNGLTEYVINQRRALCIQGNFQAELIALGVELIGKPAESWLGVPIVAGNQTLGAIVVQSSTVSDLYDTSHKELLMTIAVQAGLIIQNARLYARTDKALARRVQELNSILRAARDGMILLDRQWRVLTVNCALVNYLGLTQADWIDQYLVDIVSPVEKHALLQRVGYTLTALLKDCQALEDGAEPFITTCLHHLGPPEYYLERTLAPVRDQEGQPTGWLLIFHDITEHRNLARLREDMTHMLVHDLRSPIAVLRSGLELMQLDIEDGNYAGLPDLMETAHEGIERLLTMITYLLDIYKLEEGKMPMQPELIEATDLVREAVARIAPAAVAAHIDIETEIAPALPPLHVDHELLFRVLHNLLDNAIKFSPDHSTIRLWASPTADGMGIVLGIQDSGRGISEIAQMKLFKKFQQVVAKNGRRPGSGLGLPFCKLVIEAHDGQIWVESEMGQGSTFFIQLPIAALPPDFVD